MFAFVLAASLEVEDTPRVHAEKLYEAAQQEEHDFKFGDALSHYEESVRVEPSNRYALRSNARARWIRERAEGDFAPLVELEHARRDPGSQANTQTIDTLARDLEKFPPGEVRTEARMFVAEAYASKLNRHLDAERELDAMLDEPKSDVPMRAQAASRLVDFAIERGDVDAARHAAGRGGKSSRDLAMRVEHWSRRRLIFRIAIGVLAAFAALGIFAAARNLRGARIASLRKFAPKAAMICVYLAIAGALLVNTYESGHLVPFLALPAAIFPIVVIARAWALSASQKRAARALRVVVSIAAIASAAFIVLYQSDVRYLESFGL